ncbi:tyrosine-protein phosphatase non-receptor type 18 isoform X2 [Dicentrarchus labrax]|uniref:tyrosine-protein phosphatase non-receptor type 18 isoform X2 n=1 Tax=Dicentrarchus labrax TaxID=13489 RepID=UPI0021F656C0|nr:tyrosine-protein phosphatase non-receptor type 18 isoform X2 [Dicentrarchus labrax]
MELLPSLLSTLRTVDPGTLDQEYSVVRSQTSVLKRDLSLTTEDGAQKENIKKNRYKDILPYDQSRVVLSLLTSDCDSDYINASFIKGASADKRYIASQGPLSSTLIDFWRMIWEHDVKVIVMACREIEMGKKKCECYWSPAHQSASFGPFTVCNQGETRPNEDLVVRNLTVSYQQDSRSLIQYQFLSWPDHDVPYEAAGVLDLLERVRHSQGTHTSPVLVHCSAGCGRTGVICALDYIHDLLVTKITSDFSIMNIVLEIRRQRPSAVQTKDQYQFIFTAVTCMFEQILQTDRSRLYSNLPELKKPERESTKTPASYTKSLPQQPAMNDTYAVVNKPKHSHPPSSGPAYSTVATPRSNSASRSLPSSHHYDNDAMGAAAPVYSTVRPRAKGLSLQHSATPIYDMATPANHRLGEGPASLGNNGDYQLIAADHLSEADDDYEDFSSSVSDSTNPCSPGGIGFNCRIQKPRGPRDPPAEWSRLER